MDGEWDGDRADDTVVLKTGLLDEEEEVKEPGF